VNERQFSYFLFFSDNVMPGKEMGHTLQGSVRCSAFAKCLILIPLHENICKDYGFFEAGTEMQSPHNNPIIYIFFIGLEHSGQPGRIFCKEVWHEQLPK
jgi:hypothetical protein